MRINAAILGLTPAQIDERFDDMLAFADIGDFIDQPVKTYSSGMYVRLAFSVAIHVSPDILVVDEALAVGDAFFQARCMARMKRMLDDGITMLFISHDIAAVKALCSDVLWLERGRVRAWGPTDSVASQLRLRTRPCRGSGPRALNCGKITGTPPRTELPLPYFAVGER